MEKFKKILALFFIWRAGLFFVLVIILTLIPLNSDNFLGGGLESYQHNPYLFAWANFDGEHYLSIAKSGYGNLNHSFFPLYPLMIKLFSFSSNDATLLVITGLLISNITFILSLFFLWKLIRLDYSEKISDLSFFALILFPTSFYFGAFYTESLFLLLVISTFYLARLKKWWWAGVLGALASATRITGILLLPALFLEWWQEKSIKSLLPILLIPVGFLGYMTHLYQTTGSPLTFYQELSTFGPQRSGNLIILPQVFYRYFNILLTSEFNVIYWAAVLELVSALVVIILLIYGYLKKVRWSYLFFVLASFILPTLTGSFSSLPRYLLTMFPLFIILGIYLSKQKSFQRVIVYILMIALLIIETTLFLRGYWVA